MSVEVRKIDSSDVDLFIAREQTAGVLPGTPVWRGHLANQYPDVGGQLTKRARAPISRRRARLKGSTTDKDAVGGFSEDLTQAGLSEDVFPGVFMAQKRRGAYNGPAPEAQGLLIGITALNGYEVAVGQGATYAVGDLLWAEGNADPANNGLKTVTAVVADEVDAAGLVDDASPAGSIRRVGFKFPAGDLEVVTAVGALPILRAAVTDVSALGLRRGHWVHVGGDDPGAAGDAFTAPENNGFARVFDVVGTTDIVLDLTSGGADGETDPSTEAGGTKEIALFIPDMTRNEATDSPDYDPVTFRQERTLGRPNPVAEPTRVQSENVGGCFTSQVVINVPAGDAVTADVVYTALTSAKRDGTVGQEPLSDSGTKVPADESDAFNTSSDVSIIKMAILPPTSGVGATSVPQRLFGFVTDMTATLGNNINPNKAVGVVGAFDASVGNFTADVEVTAYFTDTAGAQAVEDNADVVLYWTVVKQWAGRTAGILLDICLLSLGDGQLVVNADESITMPLSGEDGQYTPFGHNAALCEFWYLPQVADV